MRQTFAEPAGPMTRDASLLCADQRLADRTPSPLGRRGALSGLPHGARRVVLGMTVLCSLAWALLAGCAGPAAFAPEPSPLLSLSPGQMQSLALRFVGPLSIGGLSLWLQR